MEPWSHQRQRSIRAAATVLVLASRSREHRDALSSISTTHHRRRRRRARASSGGGCGGRHVLDVFYDLLGPFGSYCCFTRGSRVFAA